MSERRGRLRCEQRAAIWKWRWLGLRQSTPGFKGSLIALAIAAVCIGLIAFSRL